MAQRTGTIAAIVLIATGLVWIGQGTGILAGTGFMVGDVRWAWFGLICLAAGVVLGFVRLRTARR
jgi:hypothetical protein